MQVAGETPVLSAEIFAIPLDELQHVVYAPLRRAAFVTTGRIVNILADLQDGKWDAAVDRGTEVELVKIRDRMVDVLNRRNYIRNLVRDVNEALE